MWFFASRTSRKRFLDLPCFIASYAQQVRVRQLVCRFFIFGTAIHEHLVKRSGEVAFYTIFVQCKSLQKYVKTKNFKLLYHEHLLKNIAALVTSAQFHHQNRTYTN